MKRITVLFVLLTGLLWFSSGCSTVDHSKGQGTLGYAPARFYDFLDILELNLGIDSKFSLFAVGSVEPIAVGLGLYESEKFGFDGRMAGQWKESRAEVDLAIESFVQYKKEPGWGNRYLFNPYYSPFENKVEGDDEFLFYRWGFSQRLYDHERRFLDITAEAHLLVIGVDIGVSPIELMDFLFGLFTIDVISDDDWITPMPDRRVPFLEEEDEDSESAVIMLDEG